MSWFSRQIVVTGANAEDAHALMHEFNIEHHAFHAFNGLNFTEVGGILIDRGSEKVTIPLHGQAALNPHAVARKLQQRNPNWKIEINGQPAVALGNTFNTGGMRLVKAPSVWGLLKRLLWYKVAR